MKHTECRLERLLELARRGRPAGAPEPRVGFATRVAARWAAQDVPSDPLAVWERLTRWGLAGALAICLLVFVVGRQFTPSSPSALETFAGLVDDESL